MDQSGDFEQSGRAYATADAHRNDNITRTAPLPLDQRMADPPRSGHPVWVSHRDRTTVDIVTIGVAASDSHSAVGDEPIEAVLLRIRRFH